MSQKIAQIRLDFPPARSVCGGAQRGRHESTHHTPHATDIPQTGDASAPCTEFMMPTGAAPDHEGPIFGLIRAIVL